MTKAVQRRRGTNSEHSSFTGLVGELTINTTNYSAHIHDGSTAGGYELARADGSNVSNFAVGGNLNVTGDVTIGGNITLGDADTDSINITADLTSNLIPNANNTYDLGSSSKKWRNLYIDGTANIGTVTADGLSLGDNDKATFGNSNDLEIYHDGSDSYITDVGTGDLFIKGGNDLRLQTPDGEAGLTVNQNGSVQVYYDNAEKLATTSTGIDVTGTATMDGLTVNGQVLVENGNTVRVERPDGLAWSQMYMQAGGSGGMTFLNNNNDGFEFKYTTGGDKLTIANNGDISFYEDTGTTAKFFWDASAEFLGIGTTSPNQLLHVAGSGNIAIKLDSTSTGGDAWRIFSNDDTSSQGGGSMAFYNEDTATYALNLQSNGNVGIGVTPSAWYSGNKVIDIGTRSALWSGGAGQPNLGHNCYVNTSGNFIYKATTSANYYTQDGGHKWYNAASGTAGTAITFTQAMTLDASGNLLVGATSSIGYKFEVTATTDVAQFIANSAGASGAQIQLFHDSASPANDDVTSLINFAGRDSAAQSTIYSRISGISTNVTNGSESGAIAFSTRNLGTFAERMRIDASGNIGIGTSSPSSIFEVYGSGKSIINNDSSTTTGRSVLLQQAGINYAGFVSYGSAHASNANEVSIKNYTAAGVLTLHTNNTERLRIDASGNVGINTTSPTGKVGVAIGATSNNGFVVSSANDAAVTGNHFYAISLRGDTSAYNLLKLENSLGTKMIVQGNGNVGIGVTPSAWYSGNKVIDIGTRSALWSGGAGQPNLGHNCYVNTSGNFIYKETTSANYYTQDGGHKWYNAAGGTAGTAITFTQAMTLDASGNLLVSKTATDTINTVGHELENSGMVHHTRSAATVMYLNRKTSDGTIVDLRKDNTTVGSISVTASATAYNTSSDQRLKENITGADDAGSKIDAIQVRQFDWKVDGSHQDYGMIAQELVTVAPEAVSQPEDPEEMMGVDYSKLVPMLVKEIQSLRARVAQLEGGQ